MCYGIGVMKLSVNRWTIVEGPLRELGAAEGETVTGFDSLIAAVTSKGVYAHDDLLISGHGGYNEDGFVCPNNQYKEQAVAKLFNVLDVKEIDTDKDWFLLPPVPSLETRLAAETELEQAERRGEPLDYPYPMWGEAPYVQEVLNGS